MATNLVTIDSVTGSFDVPGGRGRAYVRMELKIFDFLLDSYNAGELALDSWWVFDELRRSVGSLIDDEVGCENPFNSVPSFEKWDEFRTPDNLDVVVAALLPNPVTLVTADEFGAHDGELASPEVSFLRAIAESNSAVKLEIHHETGNYFVADALGVRGSIVLDGEWPASGGGVPGTVYVSLGRFALIKSMLGRVLIGSDRPE